MQLSKTRVLFGENTSDWGTLCASLLDKKLYEVEIVDRDALVILEKIHNFRPHIIIIEAYMMTITSLGFMALVKYISNYDPRFIILNSHENPQAKQMVLEHGASVCLVRPFGFDEVCHYVEELRLQSVAPPKVLSSPSAAQAVCSALLTLKVSANLKGFQYLREALVLSLGNYAYIESVTKNLYPTIAAQFNTNTTNVERAIRNAIDTSWKKLDPDLIVRYFNNVEKKPSNGQYIATLTEYLRLNLRS